MRKPVELTKESAASIAKWRMQQMILDPATPWLKRIALKSAISAGGGVDEVANILYAMGIRLTVDENNSEHKAWLDSGAAVPSDD